jgi:hypothetical protein
MSKLASTLLGALSLVALAACSDQLVVQNKTAPDEERALASANDVENLVGSQFRVIHQNTDGDILNINSQLLCLGLENFSGLANADMGKTSAIPRAGIDNNRGNTSQGEKFNPYLNIYRAARSVALALNRLNQPSFTFLPTSAAQVLRDRAFGYFSLGVALGDLALVYDSGAVVSPNDDVSAAAPPFVGHDSLMKVAIAYLDTAQQLAGVSASGSNGFPIPSTWIAGQAALSGGASGGFVQVVRSYRARFRAGVARTPTERAAVDWAAVIADAQAGIPSNFNVTMTRGSPPWTYRPIQMDLFSSWHQMWQFIVGMADTSGTYSQFLANPSAFSPFLVATPDRRFPSGTTRAAQNTASGCGGSSCLQPTATAPYPYLRNRLSGNDTPGDPLGFSMYDFYRFQAFFNANREGQIPTFTRAELNGLIAEGAIRTGQWALATQYIDSSRVAAGLPSVAGIANLTTPVPGGTACVPKVPQGPAFTSAACGNLMEAMKWEKRMETAYTHWGAWWTDGRGWGDLPAGSPLEYPTPYQELDTRLLPIYSTVQLAGASTYGLGR